jgi:hypothetical protein
MNAEIDGIINWGARRFLQSPPLLAALVFAER